MLLLVTGLTPADDHEQSPEVVPIAELRIAVFLDGLQEVVKRGQGHVFLVGNPTRPVPQVPPAQVEESFVIPLPQVLRRLVVAPFKLANPTRD
jgi:hypothetical protein